MKIGKMSASFWPERLTFFFMKVKKTLSWRIQQPNLKAVLASKQHSFWWIVK